MSVHFNILICGVFHLLYIQNQLTDFVSSIVKSLNDKIGKDDKLQNVQIVRYLVRNFMLTEVWLNFFKMNSAQNN